MRLDWRLLAKLVGQLKRRFQMSASAPRRDEERYAGLGGDVGVLKRAEGCVHCHRLEVQEDPDNALIRNSPEAL